MTTGEASQVGVFRLGIGCFDLLIRERCIHLLRLLVLDGSGRLGRRMRALHVAASSVLSGSVSMATSLTWWSASSFQGWPQWPGVHTIWMDFPIGSTAAYSWMTVESAELMLLTAWTSDLLSQMMIAEAHYEMEDCHWMGFLRAAFSAWKSLLRVSVAACHSWTRSSWLRTTKPAPSFSIAFQAEPSGKMWKSVGWIEARVWSERSLYWDGDIFLSTGVMIVGMRETCSIGGWKAAHRRGVQK